MMVYIILGLIRLNRDNPLLMYFNVNFMTFLFYIIHYHIILKIYEYYMFVKIDFEIKPEAPPPRWLLSCLL